MKETLKTIVVDLVPLGTSAQEQAYRMNELTALVRTYGGVVIIKRVQKKMLPNYRTFIHTGKLDELASLATQLGADLLIIGNILKSAQVWNIHEYFRAKEIPIQVWDRIDLILKIFALHAVSPESKLQIELAAIHHMGPRIFGMGMELSRQGGGSHNAKGQGETNTEIMKRHLQQKEKDIGERLKKYETTRKLHRERRKRKQLPTVGIVGYTNAGKTELFEKCTKKGGKAENKLFATLGTTVGTLWLSVPNNREYHAENILLNDTIGFIRNLPPNLFAAFRSTLEDSITSDILLHIVDASDPRMEETIQIVNDTLSSIGANQEKIMIYNKVDLLSQEQRAKLPKGALQISAKTGEGIDQVRALLGKRFFQEKQEETI